MALPALTSLTIAVSACSEPLIEQATNKLAELEKRTGGRLGVCALNVRSGEAMGYRMDERFGMCSTFKLPLAAIVLREIDHGRLSMDQFVAFTEGDMLSYAPVTRPALAEGGMTVGELAEAAQMTSDNVAANLLLDLIGGPAGFTAILRSLGDSQTRLDRLEPEMNLVPKGEQRDTTTPRAMAQTVARLTLGDVLKPDSRIQLQKWMIATRTGTRRLRAGLPGQWQVGDKTGTGIADSMANKYNDIAVAWTSDEDPLVIAAYFEADGYYEGIRDEDQAVLEDVGRIAAAWYLG